MTLSAISPTNTLVNAREEERRRRRRDLHDGLGPTLAALGLRPLALGSHRLLMA